MIKTPLTPNANWALFERLTHSQRSALSVCPLQSPRKPVFFCSVEGCVYIKHLSAPGLVLTSEKMPVSRAEAQSFGKFTPAERPGNFLF